ncbi:MAG: response regulator [Butyrivibrio sp.]|nr:response regulator [Butyrivibrio sp.]
MHIAVCDDNIADRKQTERLLGRQSDRFFKETGERLWIDSYGNVEAFMHYPQMYDGLLIDMRNEEPTGFEIARMLVKEGVVRPIVLLVSTIDYRKQYEESGLSIPNLMFIDKPLKVAELTALMDEISSLRDEKEPTLELRGKDGTVYARKNDIVCIRKKGPALNIYMGDGNVVSIIEDIYNFYEQCAIFPQLCPVNDLSIINVNHIKNTSFGRVTMDNGETFSISFSYRNSIKEARSILLNDQSSKA